MSEPSRLARVRRKPDRARYEAAAAHAVLDAAPFCHVATVRRGRPVVLPMVHPAPMALLGRVSWR